MKRAESYGPVIGKLLAEPRLQALGPGTPSAAARAALQALTVPTAFAHTTVRDRDMAACCLAGLWLYHDGVDEAHTIAQDVNTATGSYWHAIVHRREPDYWNPKLPSGLVDTGTEASVNNLWNSKYWFRRVGAHPILPALAQEAQKLAGEDLPRAAAFLRGAPWDALAFVDLCEQAAKDASLATLCQQVQLREWELLFDHCYREAVALP